MVVSLLGNRLISFLTYGADLKYFELHSQPKVTKHDTEGDTSVSTQITPKDEV